MQIDELTGRINVFGMFDGRIVPELPAELALVVSFAVTDGQGVYDFELSVEHEPSGDVLGTATSRWADALQGREDVFDGRHVRPEDLHDAVSRQAVHVSAYAAGSLRSCRGRIRSGCRRLGRLVEGQSAVLIPSGVKGDPEPHDEGGRRDHDHRGNDVPPRTSPARVRRIDHKEPR